jgi:hypothetical protein
MNEAKDDQEEERQLKSKVRENYKTRQNRRTNKMNDISWITNRFFELGRGVYSM